MPAYMSHAIMGDELYKVLKTYKSLIKVPINLNELHGYSLGADLACLSKNSDSHNEKTQCFFINMVNYICENKLTENPHVLALLYGHIAHYFLDINVHPLVYYIEKGCQKIGRIPNHHLIEGYYSSYLAKKIMNCDIMEIKADFFKHVDLKNENISNLLNNVYGKVYNDYNIVAEYKKVLNLFVSLENIIKSGIVSRELLIKISKFRQFMKINDLSYDELTNNNYETYTNPVTGEKHNESLFQLYNKSIDMCIEAIKIVNRCLYENKSLSHLEKIFDDLSYDTGVSCSFGKNLVYVRKEKIYI